MRCVRCNREIGRAFVNIESRAGGLALGPTCAKKAGLQPPKKVRVKRDVEPAWVDPNQLKLEI